MQFSKDLKLALYTTAISLLAVTGLLVGLRTWVQISLAGLRTDDACASASLGTETVDKNSENYTKQIRFGTVCLISFSLGMALVKCFFAVLHLRLFPSRYVRILNRCIIVYVLCQSTEEIVATIFRCQPVAKTWNPGMEGACVDTKVVWWVGFLSNLCTDCVLFLEPIPFIWGLRFMSNTKKISISFMLSLGILLVYQRHLPMVDKLSLKLTIQASVCIISVKRVAVTAKTTIDDGICQIYFYNKPRRTTIMVHRRAKRPNNMFLHSCGPQNFVPPTLVQTCVTSRSQTEIGPSWALQQHSGILRAAPFFNRRVRYGRSLHGNGGDADIEAGACPGRPRVDEESNKYDGPMDITIGTEGSDSPKVEAPNVVAIRCEVRTSSLYNVNYKLKV
ncbi:uncharacterized protein PpBr36_10384 [Pyricularia pennisetigena]|uniref:uncharacterized protein n=1 Tax=Pyricularia pennisetigena TaxID=1578925 RepID=UPI00115458E3|nr:uncharacterized protein PpBr36_10384 [Pyricularia pennisetigena]TLS21349.1 hypothetical protein PpBr36_10384 [Pyricularia pennisetigena]